MPEDAVGLAVHQVSSLLRVASEPVLFARVKLTMAADPAVGRPAIAQASVDLNGRLVRAQAAGRGNARGGGARLRPAADPAGACGAELGSDPGGRPEPGPGEWRHQEPAGAAAALLSPPAGGADGAVWRKSYTLARQTPDDAATEAELLDYDFHLFTEKPTGEDSVIYRTADGYELGPGSPADWSAGPGRPVDHR